MTSSNPYGHLSGTFIKVSAPAPHVAFVEFARMWTELGRTFDAISEDGSIRAVVLASALPKLFSAGIDFTALSLPQGGDAARSALEIQKVIHSFQASISSIERCPYPVIVSTHGVSYGLTIDIIAACDVRFTASNATFSIKASLLPRLFEVDVGLAADIGTLARLPKLAGNQSLVNELAFTGRNFSAAEAEKMGLVSRIVQGGRDEVVAAALELAKLVAEKSPVAVLGTKHLLLHARDHPVRENLEYTAVWNSAMLQTQACRIAQSIYFTLS
ncbi:ClpP/crotonase [Earliella scabrosa]|nr:ClpP/crotonase [Earliella scabrosa]